MSFDAIPIGALFAATILVVLISIEMGYLLGRTSHRRSKDEKESPVSAISGSVLALVAFMLAFTFGIVSDRYDTRKGLVRDEANAIRTAWMRSEFLPEPDRAEAKGLLKEYVDVRLAFVQSRNLARERQAEVSSVGDRVQGRLWDMAVVNARKDMNSDVAALYIESLNDVFTIRALRLAVGLQMRIPEGIWLVLFSITILGMMGVGYHTGIAGSKRSLSSPFLALSFAIVIALIVALDRPDSGFIKVTQQPLIDLQSWMSKGSGDAGREGNPPDRPSASSAIKQSPNANGPATTTRSQAEANRRLTYRLGGRA
jgi:hypothetical protein